MNMFSMSCYIAIVVSAEIWKLFKNWSGKIIVDLEEAHDDFDLK